MRNRWMILAGAAGLGVFGMGACGDDTISGPQFGDLVFTPSFENLGAGRSTELTLSNSSTAALGPILVGLDVLREVAAPDSLCSSIGVLVTPPSIGSLAPGAEATIAIQFDTEDVDLVDCPPARYDADVFAAVDNQVLGGATVRFDWSGTPP